MICEVGPRLLPLLRYGLCSYKIVFLRIGASELGGLAEYPGRGTVVYVYTARGYDIHRLRSVTHRITQRSAEQSTRKVRIWDRWLPTNDP